MDFTWPRAIRRLFSGVCCLSLPSAMATAADSGVRSSQHGDTFTEQVDFMSVELVVLVGVVLLALVVIARTGRRP